MSQCGLSNSWADITIQSYNSLNHQLLPSECSHVTPNLILNRDCLDSINFGIVRLHFAADMVIRRKWDRSCRCYIKAWYGFTIVVLFDVLERAQCTLYGEKIVIQNVNQPIMCPPEQGIHQHRSGDIIALIKQRSIDLIGWQIKMCKNTLL